MQAYRLFPLLPLTTLSLILSFNVQSSEIKEKSEDKVNVDKKTEVKADASTEVKMEKKAKLKKKEKHESKHHEHKPKEVKHEAKKTEPAKKTPSKPVQKGWFLGLRGAVVPAVVGEVGYQFNDTFKARFIAGGFTHYFRTLKFDGLTYDHVRFKVLKIGMIWDWHFLKNGFRFSFGLAYNGNRIRFSNTNPNPGIGVVTAHYRFRNIAPYMGIGYDSPKLGGTGWQLSADAGFWFQGKAKLQQLGISGPAQAMPAVVQQVRDKALGLINHYKFIKTLPMVSIGIRYQF